MKVIKDVGFYAGLPLNDSVKGVAGFYETHLQSLHSVFVEAKMRFVKPLAAHFIIDQPVKHAIRRLTEELSRWSKESKPLYFSVIETRPRGRQEHLHLAVLFDSQANNYYELMRLEERLQSLSETSSAKLALRKSIYRKNIVNLETGEQLFTSSGLPAKKGSKYYHSLIHEFSEAFMRLSYLCKVFSKSDNQQRGISFSHSRVEKVCLPDKVNAQALHRVSAYDWMVSVPHGREANTCMHKLVEKRQSRCTYHMSHLFRSEREGIADNFITSMGENCTLPELSTASRKT